jgi:hypothetical protein
MPLKKIKKNKNTNKQIGGADVISASVDLINSMKTLGRTIFTEITSITNIQNDINNVASPSRGTPNVISGPPPFHPPKM